MSRSREPDVDAAEFPSAGCFVLSRDKIAEDRLFALTSTLLKSTPARSLSVAGADQRQSHLNQAQTLFEEARAHADAGRIDASAACILKALDQERRAGSVGPQVLQLIKPRS